MKIAYIVRGLPGSERDTVVNHLSIANNIVVIQAKVDDPKDKDKFDAAHKVAFRDFKTAIKAGKNVVVNHSNLKSHHYYHYLDYAQKRGYSTFVIIAPVNNLSDHELAKSSNISEFIIRKMRDNFEWEIYKPTLPEHKDH